MSVEDNSFTLLRRYQEGEGGALDRLLERYIPRIFRIVRTRLGPQLRSKVEVEDVVQAVMVRAVQGIDTFEFREDAALIQWMSRIAHNEIVQQARRFQADKRDARRETSLDEASPSTAPLRATLPSDSTGPLGKLQARESAAILDECLATLNEKHREVILARDYAGGSWELVARELSAPSVDAAKQLHRRARARLTDAVARRLD